MARLPTAPRVLQAERPFARAQALQLSNPRTAVESAPVTLGGIVQTLRQLARQPGPLAGMLTPWSLADVRMLPSSLTRSFLLKVAARDTAFTLNRGRTARWDALRPMVDALLTCPLLGPWYTIYRILTIHRIPTIRYLIRHRIYILC